MASSLGLHNPLRYRGYVYDNETGLYYLQSRYYNPTIGRFINVDALIATGQGILGNNMFAYCRNNPISRKDASGTADISYTQDDETPWDDMVPDNLGVGGGSGGSSYLGNVASGGKSSPSGTQGSLLPKEYYTKAKAPNQSTPLSTYTVYRYNDYTKKWEYSTAYYDIAGRQALRIDWTNHGRLDHGNPHIHRYYYSDIFRDGISERIN